ncbi:MAG TPA: universal stress protein [Candidatus Binataceae bacterium]|nr:universal stress protein [Candidatus Binataceae bacterium]
MPFNKILAPTDFSEDSNHALQYAEELARKFGSEMIVMHVAQALAPVTFSLDPGGSADPLALETIGRIAEEQRLAAQRELDRIVHNLRDSGLRARSLLRVGAAFVEILTTAQSETADLIVMATHGRSGLAHMLLGSVADRVVAKAPCPVLTVRHPDRKFRHPLDK